MSRLQVILPVTLLILFGLNGCANLSTRMYRDLEKREYTEVMERGQRHLEKHSEDWKVRRYTGDAAWALGDTIEAYNIWRPAAPIYMIEQPRLGRKLTRLAVRRGDFALADTLLGYKEAFAGSELLDQLHTTMSVIVKQMRIQATWAVQRGDSAIVHDQWELAAGLYQRAAESYSSRDNEARAAVLRAWRIVQDGLSGYEIDAEKVLQNATLLSPGQAVVRYLTACVYLDLGQFEKARKQFEDAAGMEEQQPWANLSEKALEQFNATD
ncbi:hypothetical protein KQI63_07975 [bacterium]|nr:hypothetical protein [bacterium]